MKAENRGNEGFLQRESVEHQGYAEARSTDRREGKERGGASGLLEAILDRDNLNRAYKRVKSNHGAAGIDGMSVEEALPWIKEHREKLLQSIRDGSYEPSTVRRKEIPKPDGGVRKLGIPTVVDRVIQQGIAQKLQNIWEPQFSDSSYGYRPKRSGQQAIEKVKEYAEEGYRYAVSVDLSKYFDTLNHELLMNLLHRKIQDMRVLRIIKKYLKSGVMENGVVSKTEEGSPQGGPLSPLLANIYLNEFDWEMHRRGVKTVRYADDIVVFAKSKRAAERLMESSRKYLEGKLKLLTKRNRGRNVRRVMAEVKVFIRGWLGYFHVADMKRTMKSWDEWLRRRFRMYIWKQWKKPRTKVANLRKLGIPADKAYQWGNSRLGYWRIAGSPVLACSITNERLATAGYFGILNCYESLHSCD